MKHFSMVSAVLIAMILVSSCAGVSTMSPNPANPIQSVAVLPLVNVTNDVDGPQVVREKLIAAIEKYRYSVMPMKEVDQRLSDQLGITLGGQLQDATVDQLRDVLNVDGLVYGTLMNYGETTTGVYNVKKVRGTFKLVDASSGETRWENGLGVKSELKMSGDAGIAANLIADVADSKDNDVPWVTLGSYKSNQNYERTLAFSLVTSLASKAAGIYLSRETSEMIKRVMVTFPVGPGVTIDFAADDPGE